MAISRVCGSILIFLWSSSQGAREGDMQKEHVREIKYGQSWLSTSEKKEKEAVYLHFEITSFMQH